MDFVLETITPDIFYHNLLLGLPKLLRRCRKRGIMKMHLSRFPTASHEQILNWEQINEVTLPEDVRNFYYSTDGFLYQWSCSYGSSHLLVLGRININPIDSFIQITGYKERTNPGVSLCGSTYSMRLGNSSKVFEMCHLDSGDRVCLVYLDKKYVPTVWLCTPDMRFHFLADSFTKYFSMSVAHMGFPNWQLLYTPAGVPEWTAILMRLICPGILTQHFNAKTVEMMRNYRIIRAQKNIDCAQVNVLDPSVFKNPHYKKPVTVSSIMKDDRALCRNQLSVKKKMPKTKSRYTSRKSGSAIALKTKKPSNYK